MRRVWTLSHLILVATSAGRWFVCIMQMGKQTQKDVAFAWSHIAMSGGGGRNWLVRH